MDYIKRFFGLSDGNRQFNNKHYQQDQSNNEEVTRFSNTNDDIRGPSFHVFSDPLHMQQYFEHQINEILKFFGAQEFDNGFFSNFHSNIPALEDNDFNEGSSSTDLRGQFLKNGYEKPSQKHFEKADKDVDGRIELGDLDSVFGRKNNRNPQDPTSEAHFFGQSQSIKTIRNADGSIETHRIVKDNKGNEETTVCRKFGDKEFCIIKKRDKYGKEEIIENLTNMTEEEKNSLFKDKFPAEPIRNLFDKFFR